MFSNLKICAHLIISVVLIGFSSFASAQDYTIDDQGNIILSKPKQEQTPKTTQSPEKTTPASPQPQLQSPDFKKPISKSVKESFQGPSKKAIVTSRLASVKMTPHESADQVVLLRNGDPIEVFRSQGDWTQVRYLLEGLYPLEGWLPTEMIRLRESSQRLESSREQAYEPKARMQNETEQGGSDLPDGELPEKPKVWEDISKFPDPKRMPPVPDAKASPSEPINRPAKRFEKEVRSLTSGSVYIGSSNFSEKIKSKINDAYAAGDFLDVELQGISLGLEAQYAYRLENEIRVGGLLRYAANIYDTSVGGGSSNVGTSSVQAQLHDIRVGPSVSKLWVLKPNLTLEPELRLFGGGQIFLTNQLRSSTNSFPVLFNFTAYTGFMEFILKSELPFGFRLEPYVSISLLYSFEEDPTTTYDEGFLGTGATKSSMFDLQYGANLAWNMAAIDLEKFDFSFKLDAQNYSRNYSGTGNRAEIETQDAKSSLSLFQWAIGMQYHF
ncbi:MAG: hypothetical protein COV44_03465 [Deltaproteobacteria bacterium CG11_big_fil_rev_8_21_14_0_20_45_16]|nr:MAG: hypothetical protein COV44_03465 [Deltaproteobacteria bacterium CG11_big_fil_rev_8_21_14_0_20_45_16]